MKWLAILLALAGLGGSPTQSKPKTKQCTAKVTKHCTKKKTKKPTAKKPAPTNPSTPGAPRTGSDEPAAGDATPTPMATPTATATPKPTTTPGPSVTPTPTSNYPRRTSVELDEWDLTEPYGTLGAGEIIFTAYNRGEDDHNLSIRGGGHEYGKVDVPVEGIESLVVTLPAGTYTLYCSLIGHEEAGMKTTVSVR